MKIIRIFSFIGLLVSLYLLYAYEISKDIVCIGSGCEIVANSIYSKFLNISLPFWGVLFYISVMILSFKKWENLLLFILIVGAVFSIYLTLIEIFVIKAICFWCLISAICTWVMALYAGLVNVKK
ncbi:MAG: vitamin K epoxide reductase family protein [candidate division WOR-3 bacterium]|jgi:uncharacterized membrane protein